jgi:hypothetical protein
MKVMHREIIPGLPDYDPGRLEAFLRQEILWTPFCELSVGTEITVTGEHAPDVEAYAHAVRNVLLKIREAEVAHRYARFIVTNSREDHG